MISYSQNFEDVLLDRVFRGRHEGLYIDVGAWHPTKDSVTKHFYDLGWRGINLEPVEEALALFRDERPRDVNLAVALAERPGKRAFLQVAGTGLSTLELEYRERYEALGLSCTEVVVEVTTLAAVCHEHVHGEIDFLTIDAEGAEKAILSGADWDNFRPRVLVVEAVLPEVETFLCPSSTPHRRPKPTWQTWEGDLLARGYRFCLFDGLNRFYVREEDSELADFLALPANVLDNFVSARIVELEARLETVRREAESAQNDLASERTEFDQRMAAAIAASDAQRRALAAQAVSSAAAADEERRAVAAHVAALRRALNQADEGRLRAESKVEQIEQDRERFRHRAEVLERQTAALRGSRIWRITEPIRRLKSRLVSRPATR
jgi:FkbM family methyltransferase